MEFAFTEEAWEDYIYWQDADKKILKKINKLLKDIKRTPPEGIGSPEPLKYALSGYWSRRIALVHRLVYKVDNEQIRVIQFRFHY